MLIRGPVSLKVLDYKRKILLLFGDDHTNKESSCDPDIPNIVEVFDELLSRYYFRNILTDVYLEQRFTKGHRRKLLDKSWLAAVNNSMSDCLKVDKSLCKYILTLEYTILISK
jgi:hypothetical protein